MSQPSESEIKRWAMDVSDWLWGTAQGAWNEKQTTSQIIVDAVIGMIPLVGDATAVRDLIAVSTRLAENEQKREDPSEWILLVVLLFALIPVIGGVIKGIGRLLIHAGKISAKNSELIKAVVAVLNRFGHGDAVKFLNDLNLLKYQQELIDKFKAFIDTITDALQKIKSQLGRLLSESMVKTIDLWIERFGQLKQAGSKMIPQALKDLNNKLKELQQAVYEGNLSKATSGGKSVTREEEARLVESSVKTESKATSWKQNDYKNYREIIETRVKEGWPNIARRAETRVARDGRKIVFSKEVAAFSGPMEAATLEGPKKIYRIMHPKKNSKVSPWWLESLPDDAYAWRSKLAVLDEFNQNGFYIVYEIPAGVKMKVWRGSAAEQRSETTTQFLEGSGTQIFIDVTKDLAKELEVLPFLSTGWGKTIKKYGFEEVVKTSVTVQRLNESTKTRK